MYQPLCVAIQRKKVALVLYNVGHYRPKGKKKVTPIS